MSSSNTNQPILFIPGVWPNIKEERIRRVFGELDLGEVVRVDIVVPKTQVNASGKENKFNKVIIHMNWSESDQSIACRQRLSEDKEVKIIYDNLHAEIEKQWYWRVSAFRPYHKPKFESQSKKPKVFQPKKAILDLDFAPKIKYSGIVASGLSIQLPAVSAPLEPKSPTAPPPAHLVRVQQQDEFGEPIKQETFDYGNVPAPQRKKKIVIEADSK
jgi:hypothetical protein